MSDIWNKNEKVMDLVVQHYNIELRAANTYYHLATIAKKLGYDNVSCFLLKAGNDKNQAHLSRLIDYLMKLDYVLKINVLSVCETYECNTIQEVLDNAVKVEAKVRDSANQTAAIAFSNKDLETFERMQWFIKDSIKDLEEINDMATYASANGVNMIDIELIATDKLSKQEKEEY